MENNQKILNIEIPTLAHSSSQPGWFSKAAKRLFDILASALGLLVFAPFFAIIAVQIKRSSAGPVFYRGPRLGRGERVFHILKFRTMYETPESYQGARVTGKGDPRITAFGKWLRDTKVNELPQLWNVLIGQMSLVGPRPEDPEIAATWPADLRREILSIRPGITSPASVAYHDEERRLRAESAMDDYFETILPDKLRLDQLYVRHHTLITDLDSIFWTFIILLPRLGDQTILEGWLFGGPVSHFFHRYVNWAIVDFIVALACLGFAGFVWRLGGPLDIGLGIAIKLATLMAILFGLFNALLDLKVVAWSHATPEDGARLFVSCAFTTLTLIALQSLVFHEPIFPVRFMIMSGLMVLMGFVAVRYRLRLITGLASRWVNYRNSSYGTAERVLVVGAGEGGDFAIWLLKRPDFRHSYTIVGFVDDHPSKQGLRFNGLKVLGTTADIPQLIKRHDIGIIFYAITKIHPLDDQRILATCKMTQLPVVLISDLINTVHSRLRGTLVQDEGTAS